MKRKTQGAIALTSRHIHETKIREFVAGFIRGQFPSPAPPKRTSNPRPDFLLSCVTSKELLCKIIPTSIIQFLRSQA